MNANGFVPVQYFINCSVRGKTCSSAAFEQQSGKSSRAALYVRKTHLLVQAKLSEMQDKVLALGLALQRVKMSVSLLHVSTSRRVEGS